MFKFSHRPLASFLTAFVVCMGAGSPVWAEDEDVDARQTVAEDAQRDRDATGKQSGQDGVDVAREKEARKYVRVARDSDARPLALETSVVTFIADGGKYKGVTVELVGAVHVADRAYYQQLNKLFTEYDVLLYELVAPEGARIPKGGREKGGSAIGSLQGGMSSLLELHHQLDGIDYTKDNFVHADMTPDEFAKSMRDRGESFLQIFLRALGQGAALQATGKQSVSETDLLLAMLSKDRALRLKRLMARQFEEMESSMSIFDGPEGSTLITERNKKCFDVLGKQLELGHKRIGIFYGAGHLADMEKRLADDFRMKRTSEKWIAAWDLKRKSRKSNDDDAERRKENVEADETNHESTDQPPAIKKAS